MAYRTRKYRKGGRKHGRRSRYTRRTKGGMVPDVPITV